MSLDWGVSSPTGCVAKKITCTSSHFFSSHLAAVLMSMALESKGVAWLPKSLTEQEMLDGRLVRALDESWDIPLEIHLTRPTAPLSQSAEAFWARVGP
nr:hypothetical protein GCM10020185_85990 [Pseudomonas brassicacearum subsp. brassicacearum]